METMYKEANLNDVIAYFIKGYNIKGKAIVSFDHFFDPMQNKFLFRLHLEDLEKVQKKFWIRIKKCSYPTHDVIGWYRDVVGDRFEVYKQTEKQYIYVNPRTNKGFIILADDCEIVEAPDKEKASFDPEPKQKPKKNKKKKE